MDNKNKGKTLYILGGTAAIGAVLVGVIEIAITFLPGSNAPQESILDWFQLYQNHPFMGMRNMGLLNIFLNLLAIPVYLTLYAVHRQKSQQPFAALTMIIAFLGIGIFLATNRAFPMLALSQQHAAATTDAQRTVIEGAGLAMLSVGGSHSPGTFPAFFLMEIAGIFISIIMLRSGVFGKLNAWAGMIGFSVLAVFEYLSSFTTGLNNWTMLLAMVSGILSMVWYILLALRLFKLTKEESKIYWSSQ